MANPINPGTGNKYQAESVYIGSGPFPLRLTLSYNSTDAPSAGRWGSRWQGNYDRLIRSSSPTQPAAAIRPDGKIIDFRPVGGLWKADPDVTDQLTSITDSAGRPGWAYKTSDDEVETYDAQGKLLSIADRAGRRQTFAYDVAGRLSRVTDPFGRALNFGYDAQNRVVAVTDPAGKAYAFAYDSKGNLSSITFPDNAQRNFVYEDARFPNALTGIVDENGSRFATYTYDAEGRAILSEHAGGAQKTTLAYGTDGSSVVKDALGTPRTYRFKTPFAKIKSSGIEGPACSSCGSAAATTYDSNGFMASRTDFNGNLITYVHNTRGLETSRTEAAGTAQARTITTDWHATFRLPSRIAELGRTTTFQYDGSGNLLARTVADTASGRSRMWTYTYSALGQVLRIDGPRTDVSDVTTFEYDASGNLRKLRTALGHVTRFQHYDAHGRPRVIVDPNDLTTQLAYDVRGRLKSRSVGGETTSYDYDRAGQLVRVTLPDGSRLFYKYDAAHRLIDIRDNLGNRIAYQLDPMGNRIRENVVDSSGRLAQTRSRAFDAANRLAQDIGAARQTTRYGYDNESNLTSVTDPLGRVVAQNFDALNRLARVTDPANGIIDFTYDGLDQLRSVTDPRRLATSYQINGLGERTTEASPDSGQTRLSYDSAGNVQARTDARGQKTTYEYDALNRLRLARFADGARIRYVYDQGPNALGRLTSMVQDSGYPIIQWTYNTQGRVENEVLTDLPFPGAPPVVLRQGYVYDGAGRVVDRIYPSGQAVSYTYDGSGRISSIAYRGNPVVHGITYQPFGGTSGWVWGNGTPHERRFDTDGRILSYPVGGNVQRLSYDAASRITDITRIDQQFEYDQLDRLIRAVSNTESRVYSYDANGNRLGLSLNGERTDYSVSATSNRLVSVNGRTVRTFSYDAAGNTVSGGLANFSYNARGRMASATVGNSTTTYVYNGKGERIAKKGPHVSDGVTYFAYDEAGRLIGEYDAKGKAVQEMIYLGELPVAVVRNNALYHVHADHLGTPRAITDTRNKVVWRWDSDPFGTTPPADDTQFVFNLRFPGQYYDKETNLHYNYYRDYDPSIGRYIQSDPIGLDAGINTYAYAYGDPLKFADSLGLATLVIYNGPTEGNPFGHTAIATTGSGLYSPGNNPNAPNRNYEGASVTDYLRGQALRRDSIVFILPTSPAQEKAIIDYMKKLTTKPDKFPDNCSNRVGAALQAGGVPLCDSLFVCAPTAPLPASLLRALNSLVRQGGATTQWIPKNGAVPAGLSSFNPSLDLRLSPIDLLQSSQPPASSLNP